MTAQSPRWIERSPGDFLRTSPWLRVPDHTRQAKVCPPRDFDRPSRHISLTSGVHSPSNDPLHGIKLEEMLTRLEEKYGWDELADRIRIRCFANNPSLKSCLNFLRKTPWARNKIEILFKETFC